MKYVECIVDKGTLLEFINKNDDFWKMVDYIDWYSLTDFGKNEEYSDYMNTAKDNFTKYINREIRKEKILKIENKNQTKQIDYQIIYKILLDSLYKYFEDLWLGKDSEYPEGLPVSDDGYWDLRSSIIGYGKKFLLKSLDDKQLIVDIATNHNFNENFGYIFNK